MVAGVFWLLRALRIHPSPRAGLFVCIDKARTACLLWAKAKHCVKHCKILTNLKQIYLYADIQMRRVRHRAVTCPASLRQQGPKSGLKLQPPSISHYCFSCRNYFQSPLSCFSKQTENKSIFLLECKMLIMQMKLLSVDKCVQATGLNLLPDSGFEPKVFYINL